MNDYFAPIWHSIRGFIWDKVERQFACDRGNQARRNAVMELFMPVLIKMLRRSRPALLHGKGKRVKGEEPAWESSNHQL